MLLAQRTWAGRFVAPEQVVSDALAAAEMVAVVGHLASELLDAEEMRFDGVQPTGIGGGKDRLHVALGHEGSQKGGLMTAEVVHHDVEPDFCRIAGPQLLEDLQDVSARLALVDLAHETLGVDIVKSQELLGAFKPAVGSPQALGMSSWPPTLAMERSKFQRAALVEANYRPAGRGSVVEVEDTVFLGSNSGPGDSFQVFVCWKETPSRRNSRRTHSSVIGGKRSCSRQYALSFFYRPMAERQAKLLGSGQRNFDQS